MKFTSEINSYTLQGRALIHSKLNNVSQLVRYLLGNKEYGKSAQYNDNRISLIAGQQGKCYVTGLPLETGYMECHHKKPKQLGGMDDYDNLVWLHCSIHKLIHSTQPDTISNLPNLIL